MFQSELEMQIWLFLGHVFRYATWRPEFDPWVGKIPWRRKWQPTPVFLPEKSHRQRSLAVYSPWGCKEVDTTQWLHYVQMWELDHKKRWVPKNWCFRIVVLEKTLRVPWTAKRSNQSSLKEISPEYSLEGLMLRLKLQNFDHLMQRVESLEKTLMLGKTDCKRMGDRGRDSWMASLTQWTWVWANSRR